MAYTTLCLTKLGEMKLNEPARQKEEEQNSRQQAKRARPIQCENAGTANSSWFSKVALRRVKAVGKGVGWGSHFCVSSTTPRES